MGGLWVDWGCEYSLSLFQKRSFVFAFLLFSLLEYPFPFGERQTKYILLTRREFFLSKKSGLLACLINLSQFVIIHEAGPVSSTVVGHFKTCSIVAMGWIVSGKSLTDGSLVGILLAIGGIIS